MHKKMGVGGHNGLAQRTHKFLMRRSTSTSLGLP